MDHEAELRRERRFVVVAALAFLLVGGLTVFAVVRVIWRVHALVPDTPDAFALRYGEPDSVEAADWDSRTPARRSLIYERKCVCADFTFDGHTRKWSFFGFRKPGSDLPLEAKVAIGLLTGPGGNLSQKAQRSR